MTPGAVVRHVQAAHAGRRARCHRGHLEPFLFFDLPGVSILLLPPLVEAEPFVQPAETGEVAAAIFASERFGPQPEPQPRPAGQMVGRGRPGRKVQPQAARAARVAPLGELPQVTAKAVATVSAPYGRHADQRQKALTQIARTRTSDSSAATSRTVPEHVPDVLRILAP